MLVVVKNWVEMVDFNFGTKIFALTVHELELKWNYFGNLLEIWIFTTLPKAFTSKPLPQ